MAQTSLVHFYIINFAARAAVRAGAARDLPHNLDRDPVFGAGPRRRSLARGRAVRPLLRADSGGARPADGLLTPARVRPGRGAKSFCLVSGCVWDIEAGPEAMG